MIRSVQIRWFVVVCMLFPLINGITKLVSSEGSKVADIMMIVGSLLAIVCSIRLLFYPPKK